MSIIEDLAGLPRRNEEEKQATSTVEQLAGVQGITPKASSAALDTSTWSAVTKGFAHPMSVGQTVSRLGLTKRPEDYAILRFKDEFGNFVMPVADSVESEYGDDFGALNEEERRNRINEVDQQNFMQKYGEIAPQATAEMVGAFGGAILGDPLMAVVPMGGSAKAAAAIGATIGASDAMLHDKLQKGEISVENAALGAVVGGVGGAALWKLGDAVASFVNGRVSRGIEVDGDEIKDLMVIHRPDLSPEDLGDLNVVAREINTAMGSGKDTWYSQVKDLAPKGGKEVSADLPAVSAEEMIDAIDEGLRKYGSNLSDKEIDEVMKARNAFEIAAGRQVPQKVTGERNVTPKDEDKYRTQQGKVEEDAVQYAENVVPKTESGLPDTDAARTMGIDIPPAENTTAGIAKALGENKIKRESPLGQATSPDVGYLRGVEDTVSPRNVTKAMDIGVWEKFASRPFAVVNKMGGAGKELTRRLKVSIAETDRQYYNHIVDLKKSGMKIFGKHVSRFSDEQVDEINSVLNNPKMSGKVAKESAAIAGEFRKVYNQVIRDAIKYGAMSKEKGYALLEKARTEGYAPRIWDFNYLATKEGKDKFVTLLTEKGADKQQMYQLLHSVGIEKARAEKILSAVGPSEKGKYKLNKDIALEVWSKREGFKQRTKANNLERSRALDFQYADVKDFLIKDPMEVMSTYLKDSYSVINQSRYFGNKSQKADELLGEIEYNYGKNAKDFAAEMFMTETSNRNSKTLQAHRDLANWKRTTYGYAKTYQSLKLVMAQILNLGQAVVNGTVRMSSDMPLPKALATAIRGIGRTFTEEGLDFASRSGAAAHHTLMHMMAEQGGSARITDTFLTATGFRKVEEVNRMFAANMGRAHVENLAARITKLRSQKQGLSDGQQRTLMEDSEALRDLGLDPDNISGWTIEDLQRAGTMFSDEINFRPGASSIPQSMQGPFAGLVRQFQSFALFQTAFIKDNLARSFRRGGITPTMSTLAAMGIVAPTAGYAVEEARIGIRDWVSGKKTQESEKAHAWVQGMVATGMLGMFIDYGMRAYEGNVTAALSGLLGPTAGDLIKVAEGVKGTAQRVQKGKVNPEEPILRALLRTAPMGSSIDKRIYPSGAYKDSYQNNYSGQIGY